MSNHADLAVRFNPILAAGGQDLGGKVASVILNLIMGAMIAVVAFCGLSIFIGAAQYGSGSEEAGRKAKKRWTQAAIAIIVAVAAWFIKDWLYKQSTNVFR